MLLLLLPWILLKDRYTGGHDMCLNCYIIKHNILSNCVPYNNVDSYCIPYSQKINSFGENFGLYCPLLSYVGKIHMLQFFLSHVKFNMSVMQGQLGLG